LIDLGREGGGPRVGWEWTVVIWLRHEAGLCTNGGAP
jgi:hypothetical protein